MTILMLVRVRGLELLGLPLSFIGLDKTYHAHRFIFSLFSFKFSIWFHVVTKLATCQFLTARNLYTVIVSYAIYIIY